MPNIKQVFSQEVFTQMRNFLDNMSRASKSSEEFEKNLENIRAESKRSFEVARAALEAFTDSSRTSVRQQEASTKAAREYLSVLKELDTIHNTFTARQLRLQGTEKYLGTAEGRTTGQSIAETQQRIANQEALWKATEKLAGTTQLLEHNIKALLTPEGQHNAILKERARIISALAAAEEKAKGALNLEKAKNVGGVQQYTQELALLKETNKGQEQAITYATRRENATAELRRELEYLRSSEGKSATQLAEKLKHEKSAATESQRRQAALAKLRSELAYLSSQEGITATQLADRIQRQKAAITEDRRRQDSVAKLRKELAYLRSEEGKSVAQLTEKVRQERALLTEQQKRQATTAKLRRELAYLNSEQGKEEQALRRAIAETKRLEVAKSGLNRQIRLSHQLTSAFRATLQGLRSSIGIYTSATILTASAMYGLSRAFRSGLEVGTQFTAEMQKTEAIMNALGQDKSFSALEARVLSLGRSTQFTMTQVASAATELGKIGLAAKEATEALAPVLNLSIIGDMGLADSAKTATDIMLLFDKEASELSHVVDVMATAVTNSSASIGQLTNALTYAGASAHAAGFQFEEVVAAEMALANAGIRGSIAGTALRRAFTNLLNPTKKGAQVLDEFGIVAADAFGNTRDLQSIFGELASELNKLPEEEKIQALSDLFGVRAASPMAALLGNITGFNKALGELENSFGMADSMMDKMRDAFKFDALEVTSAMEALYTQVFQNNEMQLRVWAQQLRSAIDYMAEPLEDGRIRIEAWASTLTRSLKVVALGVAAFKSAKIVQAFHVPRSETGRMTIEVNKLSTAQNLATQSALSHANALNSQGNAARNATLQLTNLRKVQTGQQARSASVVTGAGAAIGRAGKNAARMPVSTITSAVLTTGRGLLAVAGHIGLLISVGFLLYEGYSILKSIIGDSSSDLKKTEADLRKKYDELKSEVVRKEEHRESLDTLQRVQESSAHITALQKEIEALDSLSEAYDLQGTSAEALVGIRKELASELQSSLAQHQLLAQELRKVDVDSPGSDVTARRLYLDFEDPSYAAQKRLESLRSENDSLDKVFKIRERLLEESEKRQLEIRERYRKEVLRISQEPSHAMYGDGNLLLIGEAMKEEQKELQEEARKTSQEISKIGPILQASLRIALRESLGSEVSGTAKSIRELQEQLREVRERDIQVTIEQARARSMGPMAQVAQAEKEYREQLYLTQAAEKETIDLIKSHGASLIGLEGLTGRMLEQQKEQEKLSGQASREAEKLNQLNKSLIALEWQIVSQGVNLNKTYKQSYDNLAAAREENADKVYQLTVAYKWGQMSLDEYRRSLGELNLEMLEAERRNDATYQSISRLTQSWRNDDLDNRIQRQEDLSEALAQGVISARQYRIEMERMEKSYDHINMSTNLPNTVVTGVYDTAVERAQGLSTIAGRREDAEHDFSMQDTAREWEHQQALLELERQYMEMGLEESAEYLRERENLQIQHAANAEIAHQEHLASIKRMDDNYASFKMQSDLLLVASSLDMLGSISGAIAQNAEDGSRTQKAAFAIMKSLAVASIIINTEVAAMGALAASLNGGNPGGLFSGPALAKMIRVMGYTSAGLVAGMAIAQGPRHDNSAGMFDSGGTIPRGQWGIVGEYGPEIVEGPARVTSRKNTAHRLGDGGGVTIAPVIQVDYQSSGGGTAEDGMEIAQIVKGVVIDVIREQMRPNGILSRNV